jgi:hypothetical protein
LLTFNRCTASVQISVNLVNGATTFNRTWTSFRRTLSSPVYTLSQPLTVSISVDSPFLGTDRTRC